jgi:cytochrome c biogenesis protein
MRLLRLITSIKTAVFFLVLIAVFSVPATFIPQNRSVEEYESIYGTDAAQFITALSLHRFFRSPIFLLPVAGFFINLSACTIKRIIKQFDGRRRNFAPDVLHLGLLVLVFAAVLSAAARRTEEITMAEGEAVRLDGGYTVALRDFEVQQYPDGRTKDYVSYLQVSREDRLLHASYPLEVNHPLRIGDLRIYQSRFFRQVVLEFIGPEDGVYQMVSGSPVRLGEDNYVLEGLAEGEEGRRAALITNQTSGRQYRLSPGDVFFGLTVNSVELREYSGLKAVRDPGYTVLIAGFIIALSGLAAHYVIRFIRRRKNR